MNTHASAKADLQREVQGLIAALEKHITVSDRLCGRMKILLMNIEKQLISERGPSKDSGGGTLTRLIVDSWPLGDDLGKKITEFEDRYRAWLQQTVPGSG
jgi:hypothetical protein